MHIREFHIGVENVQKTCRYMELEETFNKQAKIEINAIGTNVANERHHHSKFHSLQFHTHVHAHAYAHAHAR